MQVKESWTEGEVIATGFGYEDQVDIEEEPGEQQAQYLVARKHL